MKKVHHNEVIITRDMYKHFHINPNISQVYSLGILLLVLTTGCHPLSLYLPPFSPNKRVIEEKVDSLRQIGYSKLLTNLCAIMLTSYRNRPLPSQIYQIFKQFEEEIMNFKPFSLSLAQSEVQSIY